MLSSDLSFSICEQEQGRSEGSGNQERSENDFAPFKRQRTQAGGSSRGVLLHTFGVLNFFLWSVCLSVAVVRDSCVGITRTLQSGQSLYKAPGLRRMVSRNMGAVSGGVCRQLCCLVLMVVQICVRAARSDEFDLEISLAGVDSLFDTIKSVSSKTYK